MWNISVIVQPSVINLTPNDLWETIFEKFDKIIGIWGLSLPANTWIEAVTLEKLVRESWGKRKGWEENPFFFPPFLPLFDKPQLLTFGRLQSTDFCSWESNGEEDKWSDLKYSILTWWKYSGSRAWTIRTCGRTLGTLSKTQTGLLHRGGRDPGHSWSWKRKSTNIERGSQPGCYNTWIRYNISSSGNISYKGHHLEVTDTSRRPDLKNWYCLTVMWQSLKSDLVVRCTRPHW